MRLGALVAAALALASACDDHPFAGLWTGRREAPLLRAYQATSRDQLIGGIAAVADVGDFILENDEARFVILGGHGSPGPGIFGGSLADADLQRVEPQFRGGNGLDSFSELFPFANLATPNPAETQVTVLEDGADGRRAVVRVVALADNYMDALEVLSRYFAVQMKIRMQTDYILEPGKRVLLIETSLDFNPSDEQRVVEPMAGLLAPPNIFGTILRMPVRDNDKPAPGAVAGDFLFYGNKTDVFTPGYGFDLDRKLREIFNGGCDTVNVPVGVDHVAAEGDRVSYAYASADPGGGRVYVPLFASSFTAVMDAQALCDSKVPCLGGKRLVYRRWFAIGEGDAASAQEAIYRERNDSVGTLRGHLYDRRTGEPVSGARVLVLRDPGAAALSDAALATLPAEESVALAYAANRAQTKRACTEPDPEDCAACAPEIDPFGEPGILTSMKTDRGTDRVRDGDFAGALPPGSYLLVARTRERPTTKPVRVTITANETTPVVMHIESPAQVRVRITDESGRPMPGKVTLGRCLPTCALDADCGDGRFCDATSRRCFPKTGCAGGACRPYESCDGADCSCAAVSFLDVALGDPLSPDNIVATAFAGADGVATLRTRPGEYEVLVSRGPEHDIDRRDVSLGVARPTELTSTLHRVVDTSGWISGDFHVHGMLSHDAYVTHRQRLLSMMAEGVELVSSSDHDAIADFAPTLRELGGERFIKTQVGLETTTVEMGHFIGHPLRFDQFAEGSRVLGGRGGAFDWDGLPPGEARFCDVDGDGEFDGRTEKLLPLEGASCSEGTEAREPGIIGRLRALGLFGAEKTFVTVPHPRDGFFGYFDQFELSPFTMTLAENGATLETFNPLIKPGFFSTKFDAIELFNGKRFDFVRTPTFSEIREFTHDMHALREGGRSNEELERAQGAVGEKWARKILERTPDEQSRLLASKGLVQCAVEEKPCGLDGTTGLPDCGGLDVCDTSTMTCRRPCHTIANDPGQAPTDYGECPEQYGSCDEDTKRCAPLPLDPCIAHRGVVDDWFRLLNAGVKKTGVGNSDTHSLLSVESGIPRNWIRSKTDEPRAIDIGEVAENMLGHQVLASYGPFVRFDVNGVETGGTLVRPQGKLSVHASVESPLWFDVDRLEVYRNGALWKVVDAGPNATNPECAVIDDVPNRRVVNFDCAFADAPDRDAWYAVIALGLRGKDLRPVYSSVPILFLEIGDITGRAFGAFGLPVGRPEIPRQNPVFPLAITNPVWVDLAGDGFDAPVPLAPESPFATLGRGEFPLSSSAIAPRPPVVRPGEPAAEESDTRRAVREMHRRLQRALDAHHVRPGLDSR